MAAAKLNLSLEVLNKGEDGYHAIHTIFERIGLCDEIILEAAHHRRIAVESDSNDIPKDKRNLAYKAAALLKDDFCITQGVTIRIKKRIPVGAGLGGGSSDAAATLLGLNRLWNLKLNKQRLLAYASRLGADVAFFLSGASFALGEDRGDRIRRLRHFKKRLWHIVVVPKIKVSTKKIYAEFDSINAPIGTDEKRQMRTDMLGKKCMSDILFNRLEEATFKKYPEVKRIKERLKSQGLRNVLMTGSGGAVFGIVNSRKEGLRIAEKFRKSKDLKIFVARTM